MPEDDLIEALGQYRQLVERIEAGWVWSPEDLAHDQGFRAFLEDCLGEIQRQGLAADLEEMDARLMAATEENASWRAFADPQSLDGFWWRLPKRLGENWSLHPC